VFFVRGERGGKGGYAKHERSAKSESEKPSSRDPEAVIKSLEGKVKVNLVKSARSSLVTGDNARNHTTGRVEIQRHLELIA